MKSAVAISVKNNFYSLYQKNKEAKSLQLTIYKYFVTNLADKKETVMAENFRYQIELILGPCLMDKNNIFSLTHVVDFNLQNIRVKQSKFMRVNTK